MGRISEVLDDYTATSTVHGVGHFARSKQNHIRIFWALVFIAAMSCLVWQIAQLAVRFLLFEKRTNLEVAFGPLSFPAVTVCPLNPYKRSEFLKTEALRTYLKVYKKTLGDPTEEEEVREKRNVDKVMCACKSDSVCIKEFWTLNPLSYRMQECACTQMGSGKWNCQSCPRSGPCNYVEPQKTTRPTTTTTVPTTTTSTVISTTKAPTTTTSSTQSSTITTMFKRNPSTAKTPNIPKESGLNEPLTTENGKSFTNAAEAVDDTTVRASTLTITEHQLVTISEDVIAESFKGATDGSAAQAKAQEILAFLAAELGEVVRRRISGTVDEFVMNCAYDTKSCDIHKDFKSSACFKYGECYTFNHAHPAVFNATRAGSVYGLRLILFANVSEYLEITETAGARVVIHDPNQHPFPESFGFNAPIGTATSFSIKAFSNARLGEPFGKCSGKVSANYYFSGNYTVEGCERSCRQRRTMDQCRCADPRLSLEKDPNFQHCSLHDEEQKRCLNNMLHLDPCECYQPCTETNYEVTVSTSKWPYGEQKVPGCASATDKSPECIERKEGSILIEAYFEQLSIQETWESQAYPVVNLISDIAGQVGFWVGISVISIVEVIFVLVQLCCAATSSCKAKVDPEVNKASPSGPSLFPKIDNKHTSVIQ